MRRRSSSSASAGETPDLESRGPRALDHLALTLVVAGRMAGRPLHARHLAAQCLALADQREQLAVDLGQAAAQVIECHIVARHEGIIPEPNCG